MKTIKLYIVSLAMPAVVNDVLRQPIEGALTVSEDEAERLWDNGKLTEEPVAVPEPEDEEPAPDPVDHSADLKGKSAAQLKPIALKEGVALNDATTPEAIMALIVAHRSKEA